jgi:hypothetical protein
MPKKVVSIALTEDSFEKIEETSKALGMSRSELIEYMIQQGWYFSDELVELVDKIKSLQQKANKELGGS